MDTDFLTAKEVGEELDLEHLEVIRRIRRGDIPDATKKGWFWIVPVASLDTIREADWYKRVMAKRARAQIA